MDKNPSLKRQAKALFIGRLIGTIFQFLIPAIIVRLISQEDFGVFRQFQLMGATFIGVLSMGYNSSLFYFYPITDFKGRQKIIQQTQFLLSINLLIFIIIFWFYGDQILILLNFKEFLDLKSFLLAYIFFMLLSSGIDVIFTIEKRIFINKIYPAIDRIVRFLLFIVFISYNHDLKGPIYALISYALLRFIVYLIHILPYIKNPYWIDIRLLKKQLIYTLPFGLAIILNMISSKFDKFFINQYITPKEFGIYSISFLGIPVLGQFFQSIHNVVVPQISIFFNKGEVNSAANLWKKTVEKTSSVTIPAVFFFMILANEIITILYTNDYIESVNYYRIFILSFLISMFSYNIILRGANKTRYILISDSIGVILTVLVGFMIIPKIGLYGAVLTALIGRVTPMLISLNIERRIMGLKIRNWVDWNKIRINFLICFTVALPLFFLKDHINNIYIRFGLTSVLFIIFVIVLQIRYNIFIFNEYVTLIKKKLNI